MNFLHSIQLIILLSKVITNIESVHYILNNQIETELEKKKEKER